MTIRVLRETLVCLSRRGTGGAELPRVRRPRSLCADPLRGDEADWPPAPCRGGAAVTGLVTGVWTRSEVSKLFAYLGKVYLEPVAADRQPM